MEVMLRIICLWVNQRFGLHLPHHFQHYGVIGTLLIPDGGGPNEASKALTHPASTSIQNIMRLSKDSLLIDGNQ